MPRAIIDIGSNSIRLVIFDTPARAPAVLLNEKAVAKLGKGVAETGAITEKSQNVALSFLARCKLLLDMHGITNVTTVATAAARDASNGSEFLDKVRKLGLAPRLLSGEEEATTSALGVIGAFANAKGVVADLGGGSVELVHVEGGTCEHGISLPLGTLMLSRLRASGGLDDAGSSIAAMFRESDWACPPGETLFLVGGTYRSFAKLTMSAMSWPLDDPHGFELSVEDAVLACDRLVSEPLPTQVSGVPSSRLTSIPDAAILLRKLLAATQPARVVFSSWGLREGLVYGSLSPEEQEKDPFLSGVVAFAGLLGVTAATGAMVAGWTTEVALDGREERSSLRLAATLLSLALQKIEPNLRASTALDWATRKRWIGVSPAERAMLAACLLSSAGRPAIPDLLHALASEEQLAEGMAWGHAIRLCRRLSNGAAQALSCSWLTLAPQSLELHVEPACAPLITETVEKDLRNLAAQRGLEAKIVLA